MTTERWKCPSALCALVFFASSLTQPIIGCESYSIQPKTWDYNARYDVGYEIAESNREYEKGIGKEEPILLLNGFGVGSFHQHRLISELLGEKDDSNLLESRDFVDERIERRTIYCMDYLGQGRSWPRDCQDGKGKNEENLQYSASMWCDQIIHFIEEIIVPAEEKVASKDTNDNRNNVKVHVVGNSVGGHLAAYVAMRRPDLIASICLLNPTPVWGSKLPGWNGHLPAPVIPKAVGRYLFDRIRDLKTIEQFLEATYSRRQSFSTDLMDQIRGCTLGSGGHAAFASIMWSPPLNPKNDGTKGDFQDCLSRVACDVCLVFGKDDPWCKPAFAKKMIRALEARQETLDQPPAVQRYIEISDAGHCPNHEAPKAVAHLVTLWVNARNGDRGKKALSFDRRDQTAMVFSEKWGTHTVKERHPNDIEVTLLDRLVTSMM